MALERRRNGQLFYYRSRRQGGRVVKQYCGGGEAGRKAAEADQAARDSKKEAARLRKVKQRAIDDLALHLDEFGRLVDQVVAYQMVCAGWKKHHRQWRPTVYGSLRNRRANA